MRVIALAMLFASGIEVSALDLSSSNIIAAGLNRRAQIVDPVELWGLTGSDFVKGYVDLQHSDLREAAIPYLRLFDPPQSEWNPFTQYLADEGLRSDGLWRPERRQYSPAGLVVLGCRLPSRSRQCAMPSRT